MGVAQIRAVTGDTPKAKARASGAQLVRTWKGRARPLARRELCRREGWGDTISRGLGGDARTQMSESQQGKGVGSERAGAGQMSLLDKGCLEQVGLGVGGQRVWGLAAGAAEGKKPLGKQVSQLVLAPQPHRGVCQDLLSGSLGKSWAGLTQSP